MKEHSIRPLQGLPPAERAVKYLLDILPLYPELSYYLCPGTNMFNLLCEAEAHRLGIAPDPDYEAGIFTSRFAEEYARKLKPLDPKRERDALVRMIESWCVDDDIDGQGWIDLAMNPEKPWNEGENL